MVNHLTRLSQSITSSLAEIFASNLDLYDKMVALAKLANSILKMSIKDRKKLLSYIVENKQSLAGEHQLLLKSFLFSYFKDEALLKEIASELFHYTDSLENYHCLIWNIIKTLFQHAGELQPETIWFVREQCMRPSYHQMIDAIMDCVQDTKTYHSTGEVKKVAIVVGQLLNVLHAPTRNALLLASGLINQHGVEVHIINTNLLPVGNPIEYFDHAVFNFADIRSGKQRFAYEDPDFGSSIITIFSQEPKVFDIHSMVNLWNYMEEERFDALINLGDVLFATDYFFKKIPILSINTIRNFPISLADQYLLSHDTLNAEEKVLVEKLGIQEPALNWNVNIAPQKGEERFSRECYNVPEDAFVFVVVGNRLGKELDGKFLDICHNILKANEKNYLFFVGSYLEVPNLLKRHDFDKTGRVRCFDFQKDLRSFYSICNVYLNPFRIGGNVSAQVALLEKLPIVTMAEGDVSTCLPLELRCHSTQEYQELALSLSSDIELLKEWQNKMLAISTELQCNQEAIRTLYRLLTDLAISHSLEPKNTAIVS